MRYILEGEWTGYTSSQRRVVHREVLPGWRAKKYREGRGPHCIVYTDGTSLLLSVREAKPREKVAVIKSYSSLIFNAEMHGGSRILVADLNKARAA